jgi:predicted amidophosphoribosyltransferase
MEYVIIKPTYNNIKERFMNCSNCGSEVKDSDSFCPNCGTNTSTAIRKTIYCTTCGYELRSNATYCSSCGKDVEERKVENTIDYRESTNYNSNRKYYVSTESSAGIICGIIGLFIFGFILGIISIILSTKPNNKYPVGSLILGIIDIIGAIIGVIILNQM